MKQFRSFLENPGKSDRVDISQNISSSKASSNSVWPIEKWLIGKLMALAGNPQIRVRFWDGQIHYPEPDVETGPILTVSNRRTFWHFFLNPNLHFGDGYSLGTLTCPDDELKELLEAIYHAHVLKMRPGPILSFINRGLTRLKKNTIARSKENIHHHYDLGNDFYRLWLDSDLTYTCAYFERPDMNLEEAQLAKMDHVCKKLALKPGETVVEAGCGWGGFARHMALNYGVKVRSYNISREQIGFAKERSRKEGFDDRVEYVLDDYRNIKGTNYDVFVSIGMLEHVGAENYGVLGQVIDRVLSPDGRGLIHSIGKNRPEPSGSWTLKRLFPGGYSPCLREIMEIFEGPCFSVIDVENLRLHYAQTLDHWLDRYENHIEWVRENFDEFFVRAWRLYLAGSSANFSTGCLQLFQVLFTRPTKNNQPWTRAEMYRDGKALN